MGAETETDGRRAGEAFEFSKENFRNPIEKLVRDVQRRAGPEAEAGKEPLLRIVDCPVVEVTSSADLEGYGFLVDDPEDFTCEKKTFEIVKWPVSGWRQLDPETGDEAGTTEGDFEVWWDGDCFRGKNLAIATKNNEYLDGVGTPDLERLAEDSAAVSEGGPACKRRRGGEEGAAWPREEQAIYLWMSDYHPDGAQMFFPRAHGASGGDDADTSFYVCLGKKSYGDDIRPENMRAFKIPSGKGIIFHAGTWHNGVYCRKPAAGTPAQKRTFFTRQGRVHARVSLSWATEFRTLIRVGFI